ncbi:MAG: SurA N-terminal domain-containing protein, partial [bacterium]|nr:SurA N-terminal domain-containing protein [bacterium]
MARKIVTKKTKSKTESTPEIINVPNKKINLFKSKSVILTVVTILIILGILVVYKNFMIAAIVNGKIISRMTVVRELEKQGGKKVLDTIVTKTLIVQEAQKRKLSVDQKEINDEMKKIESNITSQGLTLDQALQQQGMTKNGLIEEIKLQILIRKMVNKIVVTEKEIDDYIASQKTQSTGSTAPEITRDQASQTIQQQKLQQEIQKFIEELN